MARVGGKARPGDLTAGQVFAQRLKEIRKWRGWTQEQLADQLSKCGHPIHRVRLGKLETDATKAANVSLEDVLAIAAALGVAPLFLFTPDDFGPRLLVGGEIQPLGPDEARKWICGGWPLHGRDPDVYWTQRPASEITELPPETLRRLAKSYRPGEEDS